jgi:hypothetical protein
MSKQSRRQRVSRKAAPMSVSVPVELEIKDPDPDCNNCYGRGIVTYIEDGLRVKYPCQCTYKAIKPTDKKNIEATGVQGPIEATPVVNLPSVQTGVDFSTLPASHTTTFPDPPQPVWADSPIIY